MTATTPKLNPVELQKLEKDGLAVLEDIYRYAQSGDINEVTESDMNRFKWYGLYHDKPKDGFFMLRVRLPGGIMTADQADAIVHLAETVAPGRVEITTRQTFQLHTIALRDIPTVFETLESVGLSSIEACGDVPRNVVSSPVAGIAADEWIDPRPFFKALDEHFAYNTDYSNLPRKYKVSVAGGGLDATQAPINDLSFTPGRKEIDGEIVLGYNVWVGGGLSHEPHLAQNIDVFVPADLDAVVEIARAITLVYRDFGYREKRNHARLKYLIADWGAERFREEVVNYLGHPLERAATDVPPAVYSGDVVGVFRQKQPNLYWVGLLVPTGRITPAQIREAARLSREYGQSEIRLTHSQNLLLPYIPEARLDALLAEPLLQELQPNGPRIQRTVVACTGLPYCNFATIETKEAAWQLAGALDQKVELDVPLRIHLSACPHSCSQHSIADIGLQGGVIRNPDGSKNKLPATDILLGGALGDDATIGRRVATKVPWSELADRLGNLVTTYQAQRTSPEDQFRHWAKRQTDDQLRVYLGFGEPETEEGVWTEEGSWNKSR
ncbi:MAG TPA: ferredoxin--nitrite reductase [Herpetosiphon sp.]|uniref:Ferredoxin--nitrite reductase n=1 Tax=Herpetosiphon aurantiacus (strain ATCC 23779 / DSM 785 / 114-95) TaxID=316274 RepID=A9B6T0_HERA2|nr:ferredoxin--nitrite reductase [Herpetosiphon sp.]ABX04389.1 Ferredoxin--nitrite reductase [Herpetosiphon aurantiacus DSM 785]HBW52357.1 ferredoxin--nitrite reductase [Herpetosiphon sp.]